MTDFPLYPETGGHHDAPRAHDALTDAEQLLRHVAAQYKTVDGWNTARVEACLAAADALAAERERRGERMMLKVECSHCHHMTNAGLVPLPSATGEDDGELRWAWPMADGTGIWKVTQWGPGCFADMVPKESHMHRDAKPFLVYVKRADGHSSAAPPLPRNESPVLRREVVEYPRPMTQPLRVGFDPIEREARFAALQAEAGTLGIEDAVGWARVRLVSEAYQAGQRRFYGPLCDALDAFPVPCGPAAPAPEPSEAVASTTAAKRCSCYVVTGGHRVANPVCEFHREAATPPARAGEPSEAMVEAGVNAYLTTPHTGELSVIGFRSALRAALAAQEGTK